jgi:hypothetical protein
LTKLDASVDGQNAGLTATGGPDVA